MLTVVLITEGPSRITRAERGSDSVKVLVLTGAGVSAESGIPTFRGSDGLWNGYRVDQVASPTAFHAQPEVVHAFYNERRRRLLMGDIVPNEAHVALARFEAEHDDEFLLVTQNVDDLHQRAGSRRIVPMHGELLKARCVDTGEVFDWREDLSVATPHPQHPTRLGRLRPHIVWFGEIPFGLDLIDQAAREADLFLSIGTSGMVYPASGIIQLTPSRCRTIEVNLDATPVSSQFDETIRGNASLEVPALLDSLKRNSTH